MPPDVAAERGWADRRPSAVSRGGPVEHRPQLNSPWSRQGGSALGTLRIQGQTCLGRPLTTHCEPVIGVQGTNENPQQILSHVLRYSAWPSAGSRPPASECADPDVSTSRALRPYGVAAVSSCLDHGMASFRSWPGPGAVTAATGSDRVASANRTSPLRRQDLAPSASRGAWLGLRPFRPMGVRIEVEAIRRHDADSSLWARAALASACSGDGRQAVDLVCSARGGGGGPGGWPCSWRGGRPGRTAWLLRERGPPVTGVRRAAFLPQATTSVWRRPAGSPPSWLDTSSAHQRLRPNLGTKRLLFSHQRFRATRSAEAMAWDFDPPPHSVWALRPPSPG